MRNRLLTTSAWSLATLLLAGCAQVKEKPALTAIQEELRKTSQAPQADRTLPAAVEAALAPQTRIELPKTAAVPVESRFDLAVNNASAQQVFLGIASGTRYSMLLHPEVAGGLTVNLKDVTVPEAMAAIRELYGYDYRIDGNRIFVQPLTAQTRFYYIPYLTAVRQGRSELRVISGAVTDSTTTSGASGSNTSQSSKQIETSRLTTEMKSDFWGELQAGIGLLIGCAGAQGGAPACPAGKSVMVSPHTGMLAVRALPVEQHLVNDYLKAARLTVERQVMIEAKILEVTLNEGAQSGINWAYFNKGSNLSKGADTHLLPTPKGMTLPASNVGDLLGGGLATAGGATAGNPSNAGLFGLALQTTNFLALLNFLETQGAVQVLSSPRIAAINNQKAVLKVGTDDFFVTNVSTSTTTGTTPTTTPNVTLQPFFSGISLDVTPQIDESGNIFLHVHPAVSQVTTNERTVNLGTTAGTLTLPLASSTISETDSVVRLKNGEIAAIGGLMKRESHDGGSGVPGLSDIPGLGALFKNSNASRTKQELVILLKPTLIQQQSDWLESVREAGQRVEASPLPAPPR